MTMISCLGVLVVGLVEAQTDPLDTVTGTLTIWHGDPQDITTVAFRQVPLLIDDNGNTLELIGIEPEAARVFFGERVDVTGELLVGGASSNGLGTVGQLRVDTFTRAADGGLGAQATVSGSQTWANLLCAFADSATSLPNTAEYYESMFNDGLYSISNYWNTVSYGTIDLGDTAAYGWYTLPEPRSSYVVEGQTYGANLNKLRDDCFAVADADVDFSGVVGVNMFFNQLLDCCAWGGQSYVFNDNAGLVRTTWLPTWAHNYRTINHEMGHGFGLPHSSGPADNPPSELAIYVSNWDVMSSVGDCDLIDPVYGCTSPNTIGYHLRDKLGWIPASKQVIVEQGQTQTIDIGPVLPDDSADVMIIRVPIQGSSTRFYTIEVRQQASYDENVPADGVLIHDVLTTRPGNGGPALVVDDLNDGNNSVNDAGAVWTVGEAYIDYENGIAIEVLSKADDTYRVRVSNGGFEPPAAPSNLQVVSTQVANVALSWQDNAANETGFVIYRALNGGAFTQVGLVTENVTTFIDETAECGSSYAYTVAAIAGAAASDESNTAYTGTPGCQEGTLLFNEIDFGEIDRIELYNTGNTFYETTYTLLYVYDSMRFVGASYMPVIEVPPGGYWILDERGGLSDPDETNLSRMDLDFPWDAESADGAIILYQWDGAVWVMLDVVIFGETNTYFNVNWTGANVLPPGVGQNLARDENSTDTNSASDWTAQNPTMGGFNIPSGWPDNDLFPDAISLMAGNEYAADVSQATHHYTDPDVSCAPGGDRQFDKSIWYSFTAAVDYELVLETVGSGYDTLLSVYTGDTLDTLTEVACDDNGARAQSGASRVALYASANETYHILVSRATSGADDAVCSLDDSACNLSVLAVEVDNLDITGTVYAEDGVTPMDGVVVQGLDDGESVEYTCTGDGGRYRLAEVPLETPITVVAAGPGTTGLCAETGYKPQYFTDNETLLTTPITLITVSKAGVDFALLPNSIDVNGDGVVNPPDVEYVVNGMNISLTEGNRYADVNGDGLVNEADLEAVFTALGTSP